MLDSVYNRCDAIGERRVIAPIALLMIEFTREFGVILKSRATWNSAAVLHNTIEELSRQRTVLTERLAAA